MQRRPRRDFIHGGGKGRNKQQESLGGGVAWRRLGLGYTMTAIFVEGMMARKDRLTRVAVGIGTAMGKADRGGDCQAGRGLEAAIAEDYEATEGSVAVEVIAHRNAMVNVRRLQNAFARRKLGKRVPARGRGAPI